MFCCVCTGWEPDRGRPLHWSLCCYLGHLHNTDAHPAYQPVGMWTQCNILYVVVSLFQYWHGGSFYSWHQVGLAVDDIKAIQEEAALKRLALQVFTIENSKGVSFFTWTEITNDFENMECRLIVQPKSSSPPFLLPYYTNNWCWNETVWLWCLLAEVSINPLPDKLFFCGGHLVNHNYCGPVPKMEIATTLSVISL